MCALCNSFSIARTCCPTHGAWQEFSTDGLMALTATALLKALTVHLSLTLLLLLLQPCSNYFMHQSPTAVSPPLHLCCPGILWDSKSLPFSFKQITSAHSDVGGEWDSGNFNEVQGYLGSSDDK